MGKWAIDDMMDAALDYIKNNADRLCVCSAEPSTYTEATSTYKLAYADITSADFTGPSDGDTSGRKLTVNAQTNMTVDTSGSATHLALVNTTSSELLYVTTSDPSSATLNVGGLIDTRAFDIEIADPT